MKAISIKQPWAWAILQAGKNVENRTWQTAYRGPLLIHASKSFDKDGKEWIRNRLGIAVPGNLPRGGIVGRVLVVNCVKVMASPWFNGPFGLVLAEPEVMQFYPCRGQLGIFEAPLQEGLL